MTKKRNDAGGNPNNPSFTDGIDRNYQMNESMAQTGARPQDIELDRVMNGGAAESTPSIPEGDLSAEEVANSRETARGGLGAGAVGYPWNRDPGEDVGAPWDRVDDAARMGEDADQKPRG
jgi:hypothetical protein